MEPETHQIQQRLSPLANRQEVLSQQKKRLNVPSNFPNEIVGLALVEPGNLFKLVAAGNLKLKCTALSRFEIELQITNEVMVMRVRVEAGQLVVPDQGRLTQNLVITRSYEWLAVLGVSIQRCEAKCFNQERHAPDHLPYQISDVKCTLVQPDMDQDQVWSINKLQNLRLQKYKTDVIRYSKEIQAGLRLVSMISTGQLKVICTANHHPTSELVLFVGSPTLKLIQHIHEHQFVDAVSIPKKHQNTNRLTWMASSNQVDPQAEGKAMAEDWRLGKVRTGCLKGDKRERQVWRIQIMKRSILAGFNGEAQVALSKANILFLLTVHTRSCIEAEGHLN